MLPAAPHLVLASASPRRRDLLRAVGFEPLVRPPEVDETPLAGEDPRRFVTRLARAKAGAVLPAAGNLPVLAADTAVVLGGTILGKPADRDEAREMLAALSGRWHRVLTGVALAPPGGPMLGGLASTAVRFAELDPREIEAYLAGSEPWDKAGAYAIQGAAGWFVAEVRGSASNVIGLPLGLVRSLWSRAGLPRPTLRGLP